MKGISELLLSALGLWLTQCVPAQPWAVPARQTPETTPVTTAGGGAWRPRVSREVDSDRSLALMTPALDRERAAIAVRRFFEAVVHESVEELSLWLDEDAVVHTADQDRAQPALQWWRQRFKALDYTALALKDLYQPHATPVYSAEDLDELAAARDITLRPKPEELLFTVTMPAIESNRRGKLERYFGPTISFLVRETNQGFRIRELHEAFQMR